VGLLEVSCQCCMFVYLQAATWGSLLYNKSIGIHNNQVINHNRPIKLRAELCDKMQIYFQIHRPRSGQAFKSRNVSTFEVFFICGAGVEPSPLLLRLFIGLLYQPLMIDGDDCGAVSGMNKNQRRSSPRDSSRDRTRTAAVGNRCLTA
jgi:hypothetical protein